jgi:hypothetical protein
MKPVLFVVLIMIWHPCMAQTAPDATVPKVELSVRDQIKADRAKEKAEEKDGPQARAWDRDANGKRPWDFKEQTTK